MWEPKDEVLDESSLALIGNTSGQTVGWSGDLNPRRFRSRLATTRELSHSGSITIAFPGAQTAWSIIWASAVVESHLLRKNGKTMGGEDHSRRDSGSDTMMLTSNAPPSASTPPSTGTADNKLRAREWEGGTACLTADGHGPEEYGWMGISRIR